MGASLASVYGWILLRITVREHALSPIQANSVSMCIGGALALLHSLCIDRWDPLPIAAGHGGSFALNLGLMMLISNLICYNLYGMLLKRFTATFLSFIGLLSPIFASLSSYLFLGEPLSWTLFAATGVVSIGLWMVYSAELKQGYIPQRNPS
jgi:drug/metabolite transporter (DMT)-like permease